MADPLVVLSATGNRFAVLDGFEVAASEDPGALAVLLAGVDGLALDGLLQLLPPTADGDCRMVVHNVDGSRAESCGNGLRCVARLAVERGRVAGRQVRVETDAGTRVVELLGDDLSAARADLGAPRVVDTRASIGLAEAVVEGFVLELGNPHCVLFVPDAETAPVAWVGREVERHPLFPERTNVEFVDVRSPGELRVRIWERGVGETASCGTGVAAAAVAAIRRGRVSAPVRVETHGGSLVVHCGDGGVQVEGKVSPVERVLDASLLGAPQA